MIRSGITLFIIIMLTFCNFIIGCGDKKTGETSKKEVKVVNEVPREYDDLQKVFIKIDKDIKAKGIEKLANESRLYFSKVTYNGSYKYQLAATEEDTAQKYKKSHGDYLEVCFDSKTNDLKYCGYVNASNLKTALYYVYGYYFEFGEKKPDNKYTGYYSNNPMKKDGIEINSSKTGYKRMSNAKDALNDVLNSKN